MEKRIPLSDVGLKQGERITQDRIILRYQCYGCKTEYSRSLLDLRRWGERCCAKCGKNVEMLEHTLLKRE